MDLKLPPLGEGADSGTVVNLFVKAGDQIAKDQPVIELENEKAVASRLVTASAMTTAQLQTTRGVSNHQNEANPKTAHVAI